MAPYLIVALLGGTVAVLVALVGLLVPARSRAVARQLAMLRSTHEAERDVLAGHRRRERSERLTGLLELMGNVLTRRGTNRPAARLLLVHAGYRGPSAVAVFWGARLALAAGLGGGAALLAPAAGGGVVGVVLGGLWGATLGWIAPAFYVGARARKRQKEIQRALPDALDLLVVCVEAGLALNQAIVRVADEIRHVSGLMGDELSLVNLEIRAGAPRQDALRNLGERTGVADLRSLTAMLIQTDRFGTSIAQALRVHSDTMRTKRRQRAEEAAAKTTIKLVFPLVFCVFPALFVVILGPALILIYRTLGGMK